VMRLLVDTHVFLWYVTADPKLPESFQGAIQNALNDVFLSSVSVWEAVIKHNLGNFSLPLPPATYLPQQRSAHSITAPWIVSSPLTQYTFWKIVDRNASLPVNDWIRRCAEQSGSSWGAAHVATASGTRPRTSIWPVTAAEIRAERRSRKSSMA
jgi:PIN domain nuclease of toxin-antitoxin system